jgi:4-aminobutyrate aminotransferase-like enzyme
MFAIEHYGVEPDVIATANGIVSGMPLGVTCARADVMACPEADRLLRTLDEALTEVESSAK